MWELKILVELRGQPDPAGLNAPVLKIVFLMIGFAGRFKLQPYIVQQGRLFFLRREVAARTAHPTKYSANARCVCSASAVIVPPAMLNASSIGATVSISFVRFRSSLPFTGSVPTFFGRSSVCCRVPPHSSRAPAALTVHNYAAHRLAVHRDTFVRIAVSGYVRQFL